MNTHLLVEPSTALPLCDVALLMPTGSSIDRGDQLGLTRAAFRMLRRGTKRRSNEQVEEAIDALGAELAFEVSAFGVAIHAQVIERSLDSMVALIEELLTESTFDEQELEQLKRETIAEIIESRDQDKSLCGKFFRRALFGEHPLGRGSAGSEASNAKFTADDIRRALKQHFGVGELIVAATGNLAPETDRFAPALRAFQSTGAHKPEATEPTIPTGRHLLFVDKPERTQTQIMIGGLGTSPNDVDHLALHVGNTVFGGTFTARLMRAVRSDKGWSYGAYSRMPIERVREAFWMWTFPKATDAAACIALQMELLGDWVHKGITREELAFAKGNIIESYAFDIDTPWKRVRQKADELLLDLPAGYFSEFTKRVEAVTLAEVNEAIAKRVSLDHMVFTVVGTASDLLGQIEKAIPKLQSTRVIAYDTDV